MRTKFGPLPRHLWENSPVLPKMRGEIEVVTSKGKKQNRNVFGFGKPIACMPSEDSRLLA